MKLAAEIAEAVVLVMVVLSSACAYADRNIFEQNILLNSFLVSQRDAEFDVISDRHCARICADDNTCTSFTFTPQDGRCFTGARMFKFEDQKLEVVGVRSYFKIGKCPNHFSLLSDSATCIKVVITPLTFEDARTHCLMLDGRLLSLQSTYKVELVRAYLLAHGDTDLNYWVGASDEGQTGVWRWLDETLVSENIWCPDEPNYGVDLWPYSMEMKYGFSCANDAEYYSLENFICEMPLLRK